MRYLLNFLLWSPKRLGIVVATLIVTVILVLHVFAFLAHL